VTIGPENPTVDSPAARNSRAMLREFDEYAEAQRPVDRLSDAGFPVEHVQIVGTGIRTVEQVTGRMTTSKAALYGAGSGACLGLLMGLIFGLLTPGPVAWLLVLLMSLALGAPWGAVFGFVAHWATKGERDFSSINALEAKRYAVLGSNQLFNEATRLIGR
jgi:hypothetical protein